MVVHVSVNPSATDLVINGLRALELPGAADYVRELAMEHRALLVAARRVAEARVDDVVGVQAITALEALVAELSPPERPHLTVHQGGSPPTRTSKRRASIPEGDPA